MAVFKLNIMEVRLFKIAISFLFVLFISACSGGTDSTVTNTDETKDTIILTVLDDNGDSVSEITQGERVLFIATVLHAGSGDFVVGAKVEFTISSGVFSDTATYTDKSGQASLIYDSTSATLGKNVATATYINGDEISSVSFLFDVIN